MQRRLSGVHYIRKILNKESISGESSGKKLVYKSTTSSTANV